MEKIDIPNYPDYELHYSDTEQKVYSKRYDRYLKNSLNKQGYYQVGLCNSESVKTWCLHRIVWICLKGDIPEGLEVNHINECKTDNRIDNLNLMTPKENCNWGTRNQRQAEKQSIPIVGVHKTTLDVIDFPSAMQAQRTDKRFNNAHINQCCQHKCKSNGTKILTVNKYYFFYKEEFDKLLNKFNNNIKDIIEYKLSRY